MKDGIITFEYLAYILPGWLIIMAIILVPPPVAFPTPALLDKEVVAAISLLLVAYVLGHVCGWLQTKLPRQGNEIVEIWNDPALKAVSVENRRAAFSIFDSYYPQLIENIDKLNSNQAFATGLFNLAQEYNLQQGVHAEASAVYGEVKFLNNLSASAMLVMAYIGLVLVWRVLVMGCAHVLDQPLSLVAILALSLVVMLMALYRIPHRSRLHVLLVYRAFFVCRLRLLEGKPDNGKIQ